MGFSDNFFKKVESKTNVSKDKIINLAKKVQTQDLKNEANLKDLIKEISEMAGKSVSKEQEDKIIKAVIGDKIPKDLDKFV
jgi:predicted transcriptional regulator